MYSVNTILKQKHLYMWYMYYRYFKISLGKGWEIYIHTHQIVNLWGVELDRVKLDREFLKF